MISVGIDTPQNIKLELPVASIGDRIVAHIIDYGLIIGYIVIMFIFFQLAVVFGGSDYALPIVLAMPLVLCDLICELAFNGQNAGKRIMRIKVVMLDGSQPTFMALFIRWIFRIVDNLLLFGSVSTIAIIFNGRGQRLGDIAAGTAVIKLQKKQNVEDLGNFRLPENYKPVFKEAMQLSANDFNIISEILLYRRTTGEVQPVFDAMSKAKQKLEDKLGFHSDLNASKFLYTLRNDYIFYNKRSSDLSW
jgi:uncharacterized RDD family membrane protein YckC